MNEALDDNYRVRCNAYHEAGHAVAAIVCGFSVVDVDIRSVFVPGVGNTQGSANLALPAAQTILGQGEDAVMPILIVLLAGVFAEQRINSNAGLDYSQGQSDGNRAMMYAAFALCTPVMKNGVPTVPGSEVMQNMDSIMATIERAFSKAKEFVGNHAPAIDAVAQSLATSKTLTSSVIEQLISNAATK